jgi:hypothetical protein
MSDPEPDSRADSQFGPCHLKRLLGRGGMGEVDEAEGAAKEPIVALKLLLQAISQDSEFRERIRREALRPSPTRGGRRTTDVACQRQVAIWTAGMGTQRPHLVEDPPRRSVQADVRQLA